MLLGRFHEAFVAYEGTDADVWRGLRQSQQSEKANARTRSRSKWFNRQMDSQNEAAVYWDDISR